MVPQNCTSTETHECPTVAPDVFYGTNQPASGYRLILRRRLRTASLARLLASPLCSRLMWAMENRSERANLRQVQFRLYSGAVRQAYSPVICFTTICESEKTCSDRARRVMANCKASSRATYSATLLSWRPIHLAMVCFWPSESTRTMPIPAGPGLPCELPSTYASKSDILRCYSHLAQRIVCGQASSAA